MLREQPAFIKRGKSRGRFAVGIRYEREVKEFLSLYALGRPEIRFLDGPWIEFQDDSGRRWCQPDGVLANAGEKIVTIAEVKYQHTSDAWWQLKQLYLPVLRVLYQGYRFRLLEIVHWFDPLTVWPERVICVPGIDSVSYIAGEPVQTLIFNKRRERRILESRRSGGAGVGQTAGPLWPAQGAE